MPMTTVTPNPAIADHDAFPRRDASAYSPRWRNRTAAYAPANTSASSSKAGGSRRPATKVSTIASSRTSRSVGDPVSCAFAAHTNADHAHHTRARTSSERPRPAQVRSRDRSAVTWVTAKTKTRSQSSSTALVRRSSAMGATATSSPERRFEETAGGEHERVVPRAARELDRRRQPVPRGGAPPRERGPAYRAPREGQPDHAPAKRESPMPVGGATMGT